MIAGIIPDLVALGIVGHVAQTTQKNMNMKYDTNKMRVEYPEPCKLKLKL